MTLRTVTYESQGLLLLAKKAMGYEKKVGWNPLICSEDTLHMAAKLNLTLKFGEGYVECEYKTEKSGTKSIVLNPKNYAGNKQLASHYAATMAAAEIAMEDKS